MYTKNTPMPDWFPSLINKIEKTGEKSTLYKLIEEQTKTLMLAEAQEEFIFKVVDPAVVPEVKVKPARALICIVGTLLGFILGAMLSIILTIYRNQKTK